jgi:eukaryotic-like serine/threonine-protein kinase
MSEPRRTALAVGTCLGPYEIQSPIGAGGMGEVYRARDTRLGRSVAVKVLPLELAAEPGRRRRFELEARAVSALNHPHICTIHDVGTHDGEPFLVMELLEGRTLREALGGGPMSLADVLEFGAQTADALDAAHRAGIIHRDITPANIFISGSGAKVLDFGLAKLGHQAVPWDGGEGSRETRDDTLTSPGAVLGTVAYMSPEQVRGDDFDNRTDLFSLGAVIYEMATGCRPFAGKTSAMIFDAILHADPTPPTRLNPALPAALDEIIAKALEKDRRLRYRTAGDIKADLDRLRRDVASGSGATGRRPGLPARGLSRLEVRPSHVRRVLALAAVCSVAAGAYWAAARMPRPSAELRSRWLTTGASLVTQPAISPDGQTVAFTSDEAGNEDIWLVRVDGGPPQRWTTNPASDRHASWLPSGSEILFQSDREPAGIWKAPLMKGDAAELVVRGGRAPAVSADGRLAFLLMDAQGHYRVAVAPLGSMANPVMVTHDDDGLWDHVDPSWSPDGKQICYSAWDGLWVVPATGGTARRLAVSNERGGEAVWSSDGKRIYFVSTRGGQPAIWEVPVKGGTPARVTTGIGLERTPSVSEDGHRLVFSTATANINVYELDLAEGRQTQVTSGLSEDTFPTYSPDGQTVYFVSNRFGGSDIWRQSVSAGPPHVPPNRVISLTEETSHLMCSPDGRWLAFYTAFGARRELRVVSTAGGSPTPVVAPDVKAIHPAWSADSRRIAFVRDEGAQEIWVQDMVDGRPLGSPRRLTSDRAHKRWPAWSPDGLWLAYTVDAVGKPSEVAVMPADGRLAPRVITSGADALRVIWRQPDVLWVAGTWGDSQYALRAFNADGTKAAVLPRAMPLGSDYNVGLFDVSPDGRRVVFSRKFAPSGNLYLIEANDRRF